MKLSKVKKVCLDEFAIVIKRADTGIDIQNWVGTALAMYPVRGMKLTADMTVGIWEIGQKKQSEMVIAEDTEEEETAASMITRSQLESLTFQADTLCGAENEILMPVATIGDLVLLEDKETHKAWLIKKKELEPVEGSKRMFIRAAMDSCNLIAVYEDGILEAVIYGMPVHSSGKHFQTVLKHIAMIYEAIEVKDLEEEEEENHEED